MDARLIAYLSSIGATPDALDGWTVKAAQRNGVDVAFVATLGPEIHFVSLVGERAMSRRNIEAHTAPLFDRYGYMTTRTLLTETDHKLREHLGFVHTWSDEHYAYWLADEPPFQRKNMTHQPKQEAACQSQ